MGAIKVGVQHPSNRCYRVITSGASYFVHGNKTKLQTNSTRINREQIRTGDDL
jgi:hypothetical protein